MHPKKPTPKPKTVTVPAPTENEIAQRAIQMGYCR
jgi:hypothetical protein